MNTGTLPKHLKTDGDHLLSPVLCWTGGKARLKKTIIKHIPEHKTYVEPFMGGGSVFFGKHLAEKNIVGDIDSDLIRFYKHLRNINCSALQQCNLPTNVKEFVKAVSQKNKSSCAYLGVNKRSYACKMDKPKFAFSTAMQRGKNIGISHLKDSCDSYREKLKEVKIINQDFRSVVKRFDSRDTFHYLDPPFVGTYGYGQENVNPEDVFKLVKSLKGKVMVSYNDHPRVREACKGLHLKKVKADYTIQTSQTKGEHKRVNELLITNFRLNGGNGHLKD